ncbi:hypothetical protein VTO42DRAFT_7251 [Malbranchea cinnamomea]
MPAVNEIAADQSVSESAMILSLTVHLLRAPCFRLAPISIGNFADTTGRRRALAACSINCLVENIGLAVQRNVAALIALHCPQSTGEVPTFSLPSGVAVDLVPSPQLASYMGGAVLEPATGPICGLLSQYIRWRAIFSLPLYFFLFRPLFFFSLSIWLSHLPPSRCCLCYKKHAWS